jgi:tetratricopeptide (TPR) repeat protein
VVKDNKNLYSMSSKFQFIRLKLDKARRLKKEGRLTDAQSELLEGLEVEPHNKYLLNSLAGTYFHQKQFTQAAAIADEILKLEPADYYALTMVGNILFEKKRFEDALEYYENALKVKEDKFLLSKIVRTCIQLKKYSEAEAYINRVLEKEPDDLTFLKYLANIYKKTKKHQDALDVFEKIIRISPKEPYAYKEYIRLKTREKPVEKVVEEIDQVMNVSSVSENAQLHDFQGDNLKKLKKYEEAIKEYEKGLQLAANVPYYKSKIGFCYSRMEDYPKAIETLSPLFIQKPSDFFIRKALESAYRKSNNVEGFYQDLKTAMEKHPQFKKLWGLFRKIEKELAQRE